MLVPAFIFRIKNELDILRDRLLRTLKSIYCTQHRCLSFFLGNLEWDIWDTGFALHPSQWRISDTSLHLQVNGLYNSRYHRNSGKCTLQPGSSPVSALGPLITLFDNRWCTFLLAPPTQSLYSHGLNNAQPFWMFSESRKKHKKLDGSSKLRKRIQQNAQN